jgi:hypothetical protein
VTNRGEEILPKSTDGSEICTQSSHTFWGFRFIGITQTLRKMFLVSYDASSRTMYVLKVNYGVQIRV